MENSCTFGSDRALFPISFEPTVGNDFNLILAADRNHIRPQGDGSLADRQRLRQLGGTSVIGDGLLLRHDNVGLTCLTGRVKNDIQVIPYNHGMEYPDYISDRINARMAELAMSAADLARRCHVSRAAVTGWTKGSSPNIRPHHLVNIADALGLEIRYLITGKGQRLSKSQAEQNGDDLSALLSSYPAEVRDSIRVILKNIDLHKA